MKKLTLLAAMLICVAVCTPAFAARFVPTDPIMPLSQVKAGMTGEARTVISGTKITAFKITVLGVMPRKTNPRHLIVIRVDDKYVRANGGIAAGMSGSPVYVKGKLIGAIGYGWSFSDNNLGLVTPIEEMARAMDNPSKLPWFDIPPTAPEIPASEDKTVSGDKAISGDKTLSTDKTASGDASISVATSSGVASDDVVSGEKLEKKMMPLMVDGISERYAERLGGKLGARAVPLGSVDTAGEPTNLKWSPKPGAAMGAALAWGDFMAGGIGTLTAVSKDGRFVAFAHPMFNKGSVAYALMEANIVKIIPSMESSFKLGYMDRITGIITQDRPEAIGGTLGQLAAASSYEVSFKNIETGRSEKRRFQTVADPFVGPEIGATGILGVIDSLWAQKGSGTALVAYTVSGGNMKPGWTRRNIFYSDKDVVKSMQKEIEAMGKVMSLNPFRAISPYGVKVDVELTKTPRVVFIDKVEIKDKKEFYRPGDKVKVDATFRPWRRQPVVKHFELTVPKNAVAFCEITVRGGGVEEPSQEPLLSGVRAITSFKELIGELNVKETNNQIIVEIGGPEKGDKKKKDKPEEKGPKKDGAPISAEGGRDKKPDAAKGASDKKGGKESMTPEDVLEDRFVSEIRAERIKNGEMVIADTNFYIEGVLRKFIRVKSGKDSADIDEAMLQAVLEKASQDGADDEAAPDDEEIPPDDGDEGDNQDSFSILSRTVRPR